MAEIKRYNGNPVIDYMARDYSSLLDSMRDLVPVKLPGWEKYKSEADFGNVLLQLFAHMGDILGYYQDRVANESFLGTARERRSIIQHLRLIGYRLATAAPASAILELSAAGDCEDKVTIKKGDAFATRSERDKSSVRFEYTGEGVDIDFNLITAGPGGKKTYGPIPVEEGRTVKEETVGESDGTPNQRFPLAHPGMILRSLGIGSRINKDITLVTDVGGTIDEWTLQESLAFSQQGEKDFMIEIDQNDRAYVVFGDGEFGDIPPRGAKITATYRTGGGTHGNVLANTINTIAAAPQLVFLPGVAVTNPAAATGGAERETIEHAVKHAPGVFRSQKRAVTKGDYQALALEFKGVGKVRAEKGSWNTVILYVAPEGGGKVSDVLKKNLLAYFEDKRPVSTIVEIEDVAYVKIYVTAEIGIESYYSQEDIKEKVQAAGKNLLDFDNVDFGQTLYLSKFYEAIEAIQGVAYVNISEFRRENTTSQEHRETGKIQLLGSEIPVIPREPGDEDYAYGIKVDLDIKKPK